MGELTLQQRIRNLRRRKGVCGEAAVLCATSLHSCPALCNPVDYNPPGSYPWDSPGKNTGVGCHFLLQGSSQPRDQTHVSCDSCPGRQVLYHDASQETLGTHFPLAYKSPGRKVLRRAVVINPMRGKSSRRLPVSRESPSIAEPPLQPAPSPGAAEDARLRSGCLRC